MSAKKIRFDQNGRMKFSLKTLLIMLTAFCFASFFVSELVVHFFSQRTQPQTQPPFNYLKHMSMWQTYSPQILRRDLGNSEAVVVLVDDESAPSATRYFAIDWFTGNVNELEIFLNSNKLHLYYLDFKHRGGFRSEDLFYRELKIGSNPSPSLPFVAVYLDGKFHSHFSIDITSESSIKEELISRFPGRFR